MFGFLNFKILYKSFFDRKVYCESIVKKKGILLSYIFLLVLITSSPLFFSLASEYYKGLNQEIVPAFLGIPALELSEGKLTYEGPETLTVDIPNDAKALAVFHSGTSITDIDQVNAYVLVLSDKLIYRQDGTRKVTNWSKYKGKMKLPFGIFALLAKVVGVALSLLLGVIIFLVFLFMRLTGIFLFAVLTNLLVKDKDVLALKMAHCFRVSAVAITPAALFLAFCSMLFSISFVVRVFMTIIMTCIYLVYGILGYVTYKKQESESQVNQDSVTGKNDTEPVQKEQNDSQPSE